MKADKLRISIVIPVYNEAGYIAACLDAIAAQTIKPYEVIVVNNNSTDDTVVIASRYNWVRIINEPRQGVVYARDAGFNTARGEIIGRIDADTIMSRNWVESAIHVLNDGSVDAASGRAEFYNVPMSSLFNTVDLLSRRYFAKVTGREVALHGANMTLRRSAWLQLRGKVCHIAGIHEDFDLAIHLTRAGKKVIFTEKLVASIAYRRIDTSFKDYARYMLTSPQTYRRHRVASQYYMYPLVLLSLFAYLPLRMLLRIYDVKAGRFSWSQPSLAQLEQRVNPATFVD